MEDSTTSQDNLLDIQFNRNTSSLIKVIGVGGGGSNAVNHLSDIGLQDAFFMVCNTDNQALQSSPIDVKVQLGPSVSKGLGAGARPEVAREAAEESANEIRAILSNNTNMAFICAAMGGGTGTGAAPVIASIAKDLGILTVGIVTIPYEFEGKAKISKALKGMRELKKNVDVILIINNQKLFDVYPDLTMKNAFEKADDVVANAVKSITEIITMHGYINVDFADVCTILRGGGMAIINTGVGSGTNRITQALKAASNSPLLNASDIRCAKRLLLFIHSPLEGELKQQEVTELNEFTNSLNFPPSELIWGAIEDPSLESGTVSVTLLASGFDIDDNGKIIHEDPTSSENDPYATSNERGEMDSFYGKPHVVTPRREDFGSDEEYYKALDIPAIMRRKS